MVDYVAVLRRTIDALPKNTPEIRARVYAKARSTVESKLAMINPPPSQALIAKQMSGLDAAIATVESDFDVAVEDWLTPTVQEIDPLADILNALPDVKPSALPDVKPSALRREVRDVFSTESVTSPSPNTSQTLNQINQRIAPVSTDLPRLPETSKLEFPELPQPVRIDSGPQDGFDEVFGDMPSPQYPNAAKSASNLPTLDDPVFPPTFSRPPKQKAKPGRVLLPLLGLALLAGAGALAWTEREQLIALLQPEQMPAVTAQPEKPVAPEPPASTEPSVAQTDLDANAPQKFTQRLNSDGTEVDGGVGTAAGEQSVAQLEPAKENPAEPTTPSIDTPQLPVTETPVAEPAAAAAETPVTPAGAIPVGQKAIFYEERTSGAEGSARTGAVVWSVVRESPGNDRPPEPAIRGELSIPEVGLNVRMTLRRNADATLPASHILELIMSVPDDFPGGTIEDVQRVNLKPTEESAGAPLLATPVKVADRFFLVAMENAPAAQEANLSLLREQNWIDLPVVYRTGRRALFTMEKGLVGDQVFKQVLDAWAAAPLQ